MKKLLPYLPLFGMVFGLFIVQIQNHGKVTPLMSAVLPAVSGEETAEICTKPEDFSDLDESAWCNVGLAANIEQHLHTWKWSCLVGQEQHSCHFAETATYKTRGGVLFTK